MFVVFYIIFMLAAYSLGLGIMTKPTRETFRFPVVGIIVYVRNIIFPIILGYLLQSIYNYRFKIKRWVFLLRVL